MAHDADVPFAVGPDDLEWMKAARIIAEIPYPPVSAWEFGQLKTEAAVRERLKDATVYIIAQRPILWFDQVRVTDGCVTFEINDGQGPPVKGIIETFRLGLFAPDEPILVECGFHHDATQDTPPWNFVASIRLYDKDRKLRAWWSPQTLLYEVFNQDLRVRFAGAPERFMEFHIHYIGKAHSQPLWKRLRAHEKLQQVLTYEKVRGIGHSQPSLEITIFALKVLKLEEMVGVRWGSDDEPIDPQMIVFRHPNDPTDTRWQTFKRRWATGPEAVVTTELEAALIEMFKPEHNSVKFDKYPQIKGGLRELGYSDTRLRLKNCPYIFHTEAGGTPLEGDEPADSWA